MMRLRSTIALAIGYASRAYKHFPPTPTGASDPLHFVAMTTLVDGECRLGTELIFFFLNFVLLLLKVFFFLGRNQNSCRRTFLVVFVSTNKMLATLVISARQAVHKTTPYSITTSRAYCTPAQPPPVKNSLSSDLLAVYYIGAFTTTTLTFFSGNRYNAPTIFQSCALGLLWPVYVLSMTRYGFSKS